MLCSVPLSLDNEMPKEPDNLKAYSEACSTLRHYSNATFAIRSASIVQGLILLIPWANALTQPSPNLYYAFALPAAGLLFTMFLYRFHRGYFRATEFFYREAARMERELFDEGFRPFDAYDKRHAELYARWWSRAFTLNAPFMLIGAFFIVALTIDVFVFVIN
jgi:hypothetical protein